MLQETRSNTLKMKRISRKFTLKITSALATKAATKMTPPIRAIAHAECALHKTVQHFAADNEGFAGRDIGEVAYVDKDEADAQHLEGPGDQQEKAENAELNAFAGHQEIEKRTDNGDLVFPAGRGLACRRGYRSVDWSGWAWRLGHCRPKPPWTLKDQAVPWLSQALVALGRIGDLIFQDPLSVDHVPFHLVQTGILLDTRPVCSRPSSLSKSPILSQFTKTVRPKSKCWQVALGQSLQPLGGNLLEATGFDGRAEFCHEGLKEIEIVSGQQDRPQHFAGLEKVMQVSPNCNRCRSGSCSRDLVALGRPGAGRCAD